MTAVAFPWLRLSDGGFSPWHVRRGDEPAEPLGSVLDAWDYATDLIVSRTLALDTLHAAEVLGLEGVRLLAVVTAGTGGGLGERDRTIVWREEVPAPLQPVPVEFLLPGARLSQSVTLTTELLLLEATGPSTLSPVEPMARLWRESLTTMLDPEARRFPIEATSFAALLPDRPHAAAWYLDWSVADIDRDFTTAVRLYVNADQPEFVARVSASDPPVMQLMSGGVMVQLVRGLLETDTLSAAMAVEEPESLGGVVAGWLQQAFPNQALDTIRALARSNPPVFEAALISAAGPEATDE